MLRLGCSLIAVAALAAPARAWSIGSPIDEVGCHEPITSEAFREARATVTTAPVIPPTRDEAALIADVAFQPDGDMRGDLGAMALLLGLRDNDVKDHDPIDALDIVVLQGDPATQEEHCVRRATDDGTAGEIASLAACRAFIVMRATQALDGLDASGTVDPSVRVPLAFWAAIRGRVSPMLPLFYVRMGQAMHALEDGFPHTYRTADGMHVTVVLNWIDFVGTDFQPPRDGPPHRVELDHCANLDPTVQRNKQLSIQAGRELLQVALDPSLSRDEKIAQFGTVTDRYLSFEDDHCTADNAWCNPPEASVTDAGPVGLGGCAAGGGSWGMVIVVPFLLIGRRRRRARSIALALLLFAAASPAHAQPADPQPADPQPATAQPGDAQPANTQPTEPGRDVKTPTPAQIASVRQDKELGPRWGFAVSGGVSVDRLAGVGTIAVRWRLDERWLFGLDLGWNPWLTAAPRRMTAGVATAAVTVIRRYPMSFDRVNLRTSVHLGTSTLLFDLYGAPKYSTGPYAAVSLLGIDYDLGASWRLVFDPAEIAVPVPEMGQLPLWYEQFRFVLGLQYGS